MIDEIFDMVKRRQKQLLGMTQDSAQEKVGTTVKQAEVKWRNEKCTELEWMEENMNKKNKIRNRTKKKQHFHQ